LELGGEGSECDFHYTMQKNCSQQLLHFHPVQQKINTTNYIPITKLGFPKSKYEKKRPPKQQIS